jgi:serine/threonine protein kinase
MNLNLIKKKINKDNFCIGHGAGGTVFCLENKEENLWYAVKVENIIPGSAKEEIVLRKVKDNNEHIVKIYDIFQENNLLYVVMEVCEKGNLKNLLLWFEKKGKSLPEDVYYFLCLFYIHFIQIIVSIIGQIADGLQNLHKNEIIYRDLKSENILIRGDNSLCLGMNRLFIISFYYY